MRRQQGDCEARSWRRGVGVGETHLCFFVNGDTDVQYQQMLERGENAVAEDANALKCQKGECRHDSKIWTQKN